MTLILHFLEMVLDWMMASGMMMKQDGDDDPCSRLKNIPDLSEHSRGPTGQTPTIGTTTRLETVR